MPFCVKCGNQLSDQGRFCSNCGAPVADVSSELVPYGDVDQPEPPIESLFIEAKDLGMAMGVSFALGVFGQRGKWKWRLIAYLESPAGSYPIAASPAIYRNAVSLDELWSDDRLEGEKQLDIMHQEIVRHGWRCVSYGDGLAWYRREYQRPFSSDRVAEPLTEGSQAIERKSGLRDRTTLWGVLGIGVGVLCCPILGIVLSVLSIRDARRFGRNQALGVVALVLSILMTIFWAIALVDELVTPSTTDY